MKFSPVPAREQVIVWEFRPEEIRGSIFEFGMEQRIALRRAWRAARGKPLPPFLKLKQFRRLPVVISLHPYLARTFILPFNITRKKAEGSISPENLQTMLREFLSKTTFEMRRIASEDLEVEELDAILIDARLTRLIVDGREVRDNKTIEGRHIEGFMQVIFTTRAVFHDLHDLLHSGREIFFTESGPAALALLGRYADGPLSLLDLEPDGGSFLHTDYDSEEIIQKTELNWSSEDSLSAFEKAWSISRGTAGSIYRMFLEHGFSKRVNEFAESILAPVQESFHKALTKTKASGKVYLRTVTPLPVSLPFKIGGVNLVQLPLGEMFEKAGLTWDPRFGYPKPRPEDLPSLMSFLEYYYYKGDPRSHKILTRHIHWISE